MTLPQNTVFLVGAGPGNPDLLTVRASRLLAAADVVVYDNLVGAEIIAMIRPEARRIYVGKISGRHTLPQDEINALLVDLGRQGGRVVRLKGGDPYIFGRGAEEAHALVAAGLAFEVVPGITAACGMAAYAGMPLTHRDHAQSCLFVTGHLKKNTLDLDWVPLARPHQTVVFYMGIGALEVICKTMIEHGRAANTPAAIVRNATLADQFTLKGTLDTLPTLCHQHAITPPALLIVGEVVALADELNWQHPVIPAQPDNDLAA